MPGDKEGSEYMWICSWIMLKYVWNMPETESKITLQVT